MITLKNWSITKRGDRYTAPEHRIYTFHGEVENHPEFNDGDPVYTSRIKRVDFPNRVFYTVSGSKYQLEGPPAREWVAYLFANGYTVQQYLDLL